MPISSIFDQKLVKNDPKIGKKWSKNGRKSSILAYRYTSTSTWHVHHPLSRPPPPQFVVLHHHLHHDNVPPTNFVVVVAKTRKKSTKKSSTFRRFWMTSPNVAFLQHDLQGKNWYCSFLKKTPKIAKKSCKWTRPLQIVVFSGWSDQNNHKKQPISHLLHLFFKKICRMQKMGCFFLCCKN